MPLVDWNQEREIHVDPTCSTVTSSGADGATIYEKREGAETIMSIIFKWSTLKLTNHHQLN